MANGPDPALTTSRVRESWAGVVRVDIDDVNVAVSRFRCGRRLRFRCRCRCRCRPPRPVSARVAKKGDEHSPDGRVVGAPPTRLFSPFPSIRFALVVAVVGHWSLSLVVVGRRLVESPSSPTAGTRRLDVPGGWPHRCCRGRCGGRKWSVRVTMLGPTHLDRGPAHTRKPG